MDVSGNMDQLMVVRRLMEYARRAEDKRKGKQVEEKTAKDEMEEDQVLLSGSASSAKVEGQYAAPNTDDVQIKLSELIARLKELNSQSGGSASQEIQVSYQQTVEQELSIRYSELERVDGLVRRSQTLAETDRYKFEFSDGITFKITDKWSNRSTTIWGDPHVDVDDVEGTFNGEFSDLKDSDTHTTLMLLDGTRVSFTARDNGVIEAVDIYKGSQHLGGIGAASAAWSMEDGLFAKQVDSGSGSSSTPMGDTVYAGGDGNDWFTAGGSLLWGKTTGPVVKTRPSAVMQLEYREKISTQFSVQVNRRA
jgi:hypothetical protein